MGIRNVLLLYEYTVQQSRVVEVVHYSHPLAAMSKLSTNEVSNEPCDDIAHAEECAEETDNPSNQDLVSKSTLIALSIAYLSVFIDILGVSIILPIIPFLAIKFDAGSQEIGYIYAGYAGAQMISVPLSGTLSDRFGRRPLMLISLFGSFAGFLFQGLAWNIMSFILARVVAGAFGGSIPLCQSYIADVIPLQSRGRYFAILGSVIVTAFLFGPGIGAGLAQFTLQTPMLVSAAVAFCGWVIAYFFFTEPDKLGPVSPAEVNGDDTPRHEKIVADNDAEEDGDCILTEVTDKYDSRVYQWLIRLLWLASFFQMMAFSSILYFFGLFTYDQFGWEALEVGFSTMLMGIFQVVIQILLFPKIQKKLGKHGCGMLGCLSGCIGMLLLGFVNGDAREFTGVPLLVIAVAISTFGNACVVPSLSAVLSRYASQTRQGRTLGVAQSAEALARTVGPLLWGGVYETSRHLPYRISTVCYVMAGFMFFVVLYNNLRLPEHQKLSSDEEERGHIKDTLGLEDSMSVEEQLKFLIEENRHLKERIKIYEDTYDVDASGVLEIQRI